MECCVLLLLRTENLRNGDDRKVHIFERIMISARDSLGGKGHPFKFSRPAVYSGVTDSTWETRNVHWSLK